MYKKLESKTFVEKIKSKKSKIFGILKQKHQKLGMECDEPIEIKTISGPEKTSGLFIRYEIRKPKKTNIAKQPLLLEN